MIIFGLGGFIAVDVRRQELIYNPQQPPYSNSKSPRMFQDMRPFYSASLGVVSVCNPSRSDFGASGQHTDRNCQVYIFVGSILINGMIWRYIAGAIIIIIGIIYAVLEFIPSIEPPQNMREADAGWGAEQV